MKRLLYTVCPRPPHPTRDGTAIRNYYLLRSLASEFRVRTFVLVPPHLRNLAPEWPDGVEAELIAQSARPLRRTGAAAASLASSRPYAPALYRSRRLMTRLRAAVERERPSWILAHSYHVAPLVPGDLASLWIDFHNVDSEIWRRLGQSASRPLVRAFARSQAPRVSRLESELVGRAAGISCVSEREAALLSGAGARVSPLVVPNGVDLERYRFRAEPPDGEVVFFVGDLTWPPNADGIRWFSEEIWPEIARRRRKATADILGRGARSGPGYERLRFLGEGGDTRPHWAGAAVAVVPLRIAGGTRLKILEAAAAGVPVVSTSTGAEGLDLVHGAEIRIADSADDFAAAVCALLGDPEARRRQALAARRRVEERYGWDRIGEVLARALGDGVGEAS